MRCQTLVRKLIFYKGLGFCGGGAAGGKSGQGLREDRRGKNGTNVHGGARVGVRFW